MGEEEKISFLPGIEVHAICIGIRRLAWRWQQLDIQMKKKLYCLVSGDEDVLKNAKGDVLAMNTAAALLLMAVLRLSHRSISCDIVIFKAHVFHADHTPLEDLILGNNVYCHIC